jgi:hypothetical protein
MPSRMSWCPCGVHGSWASGTLPWHRQAIAAGLCGGRRRLAGHRGNARRRVADVAAGTGKLSSPRSDWLTQATGGGGPLANHEVAAIVDAATDFDLFLLDPSEDWPLTAGTRPQGRPRTRSSAVTPPPRRTRPSTRSRYSFASLRRSCSRSSSAAGEPPVPSAGAPCREEPVAWAASPLRESPRLPSERHHPRARATMSRIPMRSCGT